MYLKKEIRFIAFKCYFAILGIFKKIFGDLMLNNILAAIQIRKVYKYYNGSIKLNVKNCVIYFADGRLISGGLTDRLIGLVSLYTFCKEQSLPFKVHFVSPFRLEDYLLPNLYDWRINDDAISYCKKQSVPVLIRYISNGEMYYHYVLNKYLKRNKQIHVYANAMYKTKCFKDMFNELFRPCSFIQKQVDKHISNMQGGYVSVTFRFQQLLGDFKEGNYIVLPPPRTYVID